MEEKIDHKKEIIRIISSMSGKYSGYEIFTDWIRCLALSIANTTHVIHDKVWQEREQLYMDTMRKYEPEEHEKFGVLTARLVEALEEGPDDTNLSRY